MEVYPEEWECTECGGSLEEENLELLNARIRGQQRLLNALAATCILPTLALLAVRIIFRPPWITPLLIPGYLLGATGLGLAFVAKRWNPLWAALGLLGAFGIFIYLLLPDQRFKRWQRIHEFLRDRGRHRQ
jgi:hypothetical protein